MPRTSLIASLLLVLGLFCGAAFAHPRYQQAIPNGAFVLGGIWPGTYLYSHIVFCAGQ